MCGSGGFFGGIADAGDHRSHGHSGIHLHQDLQERARGGRGDFRIHLVRADLVEGVVLCNDITHLPVPLQYGGFGDALAHLGHDDIKGHGSLLCGRGVGFRGDGW